MSNQIRVDIEKYEIINILQNNVLKDRHMPNCSGANVLFAERCVLAGTEREGGG